jgi:hypothetical protein
MQTPREKRLELILDEYDQLLEQEKRLIENADIAGLEACHHKKEKCLAEINAALPGSGGNNPCTIGGALAGLPDDLRKKYRSIVRRLGENLRAAEDRRAQARKAIIQLDHPPDELGLYMRPRGEAVSDALVDVTL